MQKQLLKQRDQKQMDIEGLSGYLLKINAEKEHVIQGSGLLYFREKVESLTGIDHEHAKQERLKKLEAKNEEIKKEIEISKQASQAFDEETIRESEIFDKIKAKEIEENFGTFSNENLNFYKQVYLFSQQTVFIYSRFSRVGKKSFQSWNLLNKKDKKHIFAFLVFLAFILLYLFLTFILYSCNLILI